MDTEALGRIADLERRLADAEALAEFCRSGWTRNLTTIKWRASPGVLYETATARAEAEVSHAIKTWYEARAAEGGAS